MLSKFVRNQLVILAIFCSATLPGRAAESGSRDMVLWYRQPATSWLQAMPLGNGMIRRHGLRRSPTGTDRAQ